MGKQVSIQTSSTCKYICSGTLISLNVVLTSAQCVIFAGYVIDPEKLIVIGNDLKATWLDESPFRQIRRPRKIVVREAPVDIALIILETPFSSPIRPVNVTNVAPIDNEPCQVAGWGTNNTEIINIAATLQAVNVSVIPMNICNGTTSYNGSISKEAFCAGYMPGGRGPCHGDDGAGLICGDVVKGILLRSKGYALENFPAIYADVYQYRDWIATHSSGNSVTSMVTMSALAIPFFGLMRMQEILINC